MVDTSGSQRNLIDQERAASYRFFEQVLRPEKDVAFVIHFDFETELLQDITSSRRLLEQALEDLSAPSQFRQRGQQGGQQGRYPMPGGGGRYPGGGGQGRMRGGGTVLYDAVLLGSDELMRKQKGRKALVILSDGVDTGSKVSLSSAVEAAQRADTLVYSVLFEDRDAYGAGGFGGMGRGRGRGRGPIPTAPVNGKKVLERISTETGGRFFEVSRKEPLEKIYQEIEEDLRHQYSMGYTPSEHAAGYRKIHLTTRQKGLTVQTRDGYYAT
jgi:VWFA-related protein